MPLANPKHELYAQQRALGLTQAEAYSKAYPKTQQKPTSAANAGQRLEARPDIRQRIADLQARQLASSPALLSKQELGEMISSRIRDLYNLTEKPAFFLSATPLIAQYCKMYGMNEPEQIEAKVGLLPQAERDRRISALLSKRKK